MSKTFDVRQMHLGRRLSSKTTKSSVAAKNSVQYSSVAGDFSNLT